MAQTTTRVWLCVCVLLLFMLAYLADAADESKPDKPPKAPKPPKPIEPKKVKCKDKENFPSCLKDLSCPLDCPRNCTVDCASCQPVCAMPPPPAGNPYPPPQPTPAPYLPQPTPARSPPHPTPPPSPPHPSPAPSPPQPTPLPSPPQPTPAPPPPLRTPAPSPPHRTPAPSPPHRSPAPSPPHRTPAPSPPQPTPVPSPPHRTPAPSPPHRTPAPSPPHRSPAPSPPHRTPAPSPPHRSPAPSPPQPTPVPSPPHRTPAPSPPHRTPAPSPPHRTPAPSPPQPTPVPSPPHRTPAPSPPHRTPAPSPPHRTPAPSPPQPTPVPSPPQPSTPPPSTSPKKARCMVRGFEGCYFTEHTCPSACPDHCEVDCVTCSPVCDCNRPGAICKDPRFVGADGLTFYFHGKKDKDFCIISDSNLHINAHFIGRRNPTMKRDFTWIQSLGILFDTHQLYIAANKTSKWDDSIDRLHLAYDSQPISLPTRRGATWQPETTPGVSITRSRDANSVVIKVQGKFKIKATVMPITEEESRIHNYDITKDDCFAHLDLSFKFYSLSGDVNGILGQTYASNYVSRVKMGVRMPVLGGDKEFGSSSLFSTDCAVSRFKGQSNSSTSSGYINLKCASGLNGSGVVCKR